ncbi:glycosyltransferase family 2 protein [Slackia isoflavoniconvertens]|uniref:glycosyltransferase family 2 protein n=1 Tax=Slackia isoflavoniconvertens TaxID=572010 RepID=UPI001379CABB|nr:glycosyltransferase [Slackia isoflavoniconvertens]MBB3280001.1 GT2 family glycosyltransferase [Slackia isoflavoniconvertens]
MPKVAFVILHFGDATVTKRCIESLDNLIDSDSISIIVVDNELTKPAESRTCRATFFRQDDKRGHYIRIEEDGGFSYANNTGYGYARDILKADIIVVTNNDIEFIQDDFLIKVISIAQLGEYDVIGPDTIQATTKKHQNPMALKAPSLKEVEKTIFLNSIALNFYSISYPILSRCEKERSYVVVNDALESNASIENVVLFGACLIFLPNFVLNEAKAFEPETHFYYEEFLLFRKCQRMQYRTAFVPSLSVIHESGKSTDTSYANKRSNLHFRMSNILASAKIYHEYLKQNGIID